MEATLTNEQALFYEHAGCPSKNLFPSIQTGVVMNLERHFLFVGNIECRNFTFIMYPNEVGDLDLQEFGQTTATVSKDNGTRVGITTRDV